MVILPLAPWTFCVSERVGAPSGFSPGGGRMALFSAASSAPMGTGGAAAGPDRRPARRLAVGTSTRSRDASAVTGAASRVLRLDLLLVTVNMTLRVLSPDSSHLFTVILTDAG